MARLVATAIFCGMARRNTNAGTMTTPPPTPHSAATMPEMMPMPRQVMMVVVVIGPGELKKTAGQSTSADALLLAFLASGFHQEFSEPGFDALGHNNGDVGDTALVVFAEHLALLVSECDEIHAIERDA